MSYLNGFTTIPIAILTDRAVGMSGARVYAVLRLFLGKEGREVWPSIETLAEMTGMHKVNVSKATARLESLGWIRKKRAGGVGSGVCYEVFDGPENAISQLADSANCEGTELAPDANRQLVPDANRQLAQNANSLYREDLSEDLSEDIGRAFAFDEAEKASPERAEEASPACPEAPKRSTRSTFVVVERPADVTPEVWEAFIAQRRAKRAPITKVVVDGFRRESAKAGIAVEEAMKMCCERGWQGFRADWASVGAAGGRNGEGAGVVHSRRRLPPQETFMQPGYSYSDSWDDVFRKET